MKRVWGAVLVSSVCCSCSSKKLEELESRVARLEAQAADRQSVPSALASSAPVLDPKTSCARAKVACAEAWEKALPGAEAAMKAAGGWRGCCSATGTWHWNDPARLSEAKAARDACGGGALKVRTAARAVRKDPKNDALEPARAASEAAFEACKDVDP